MSRIAAAAWVAWSLGWAVATLGSTLASSPWNLVLFVSGVLVAGGALVVGRARTRR